MATADQVKALVRSHAEGDESRFYAVVLQMAAQAARTGHGKLAIELRDLVDEAKKRTEGVPGVPRARPVPVVQPRGELAGLLTASYPRVRLADMALDPGVLSRIERVLTEQRERERIQQHGLSPLRKLLLVGPPGTGKTLTASALAGELSVPLFRLQLDGVITKYMGETAAKLRLVFDAVQSSRAVYFFDEFDALGGERAAKNDVGEIRRVLNSFLLFLEQDESDSLVVAATNHAQLLDRALFRRFDAVIEYRLPSVEVAARVLKGRLAFLDTSQVDWGQIALATEGLSHAELTRACDHAAKNAILDRKMDIVTEDLLKTLGERRATAG